MNFSIFIIDLGKLGVEVTQMIGKRIRKLRLEKGLTQQELGDIIHVTKVSICCYENETRTPSIDTLNEIGAYFGKDINYFLGNDEYVVAENDVKYGTSMAKEEIQFIKELRKIPNIHNKILNNPKRIVELIVRRIG